MNVEQFVSSLSSISSIHESGKSGSTTSNPLFVIVNKVPSYSFDCVEQLVLLDHIIMRGTEHDPEIVSILANNK